MSLPPHAQPTVPMPPRRRNQPLLVIGIAAAAVLVVCGACTALVLIGNSLGDDGGTPAGGVRPTVVTTPASPAASASPDVPVMVAMPDVVGKNAAVAKDELERAGFSRVELGSQDDTSQYVVVPANWTVVEQSAVAGEQVDPDALVVLTCTKGG